MANKVLNVLCLDSDDAAVAALRGHLTKVPGREFACTHQRDVGAALRELGTGVIDILFLDYRINTLGGVDVLKAVRDSGDTCPVIILTDEGNEYVAASVIRAGADDYLIKSDLDVESVRRAIDIGLARHQQRRAERELAQRSQQAATLSQQLAEANMRLARLARLDSLTDLVNRGAWREAAALEHERSLRYGRAYCVLMIDADCFKGYNDTFGHQRGDVCLQQIARCITTNCRGIDLVGRYGGEEFVILVPETDINGGRILAERLRQAVWDLDITHPTNPAGPRVTISIGVSSALGADWEDAVKAADDALYEAKRAGRNQVAAQVVTGSRAVDV